MLYASLGHSGIKVSRVCVGGMSFGAPDTVNHEWTVGPEATEAVIRRAFELGINYIDTANCYAHGTSEEFIGAALRHAGIRREDVVLQSKVYFNEGRLSRDAIDREIDGTLRRLGTDYLDVYMIHRFDYTTPVEETMEALDGLVRQGKVRAIGASEMYAYQLHDMQDVAKANGWQTFTNMQCHYNLLYREDERELIPVCRQFNMALTPYSPLAGGHLARPTWDSSTLRGKTDGTVVDKYGHAEAADKPIVRRVAKVAADHGVPMAQVAIAWLIARGVECPTVGFSKPSRVDAAAAALELRLSDDEVAYLEEPYTAHELVGPLARPGEKANAGTTTPVRK